MAAKNLTERQGTVSCTYVPVLVYCVPTYVHMYIRYMYIRCTYGDRPGYVRCTPVCCMASPAFVRV